MSLFDNIPSELFDILTSYVELKCVDQLPTDHILNYKQIFMINFRKFYQRILEIEETDKLYTFNGNWKVLYETCHILDDNPEMLLDIDKCMSTINHNILELIYNRFLIMMTGCMDIRDNMVKKGIPQLTASATLYYLIKTFDTKYLNNDYLEKYISQRDSTLSLYLVLILLIIDENLAFVMGDIFRELYKRITDESFTSPLGKNARKVSTEIVFMLSGM
jgi:hypothetical protein